MVENQEEDPVSTNRDLGNRRLFRGCPHENGRADWRAQHPVSVLSTERALSAQYALITRTVLGAKRPSLFALCASAHLLRELPRMSILPNEANKSRVISNSLVNDLGDKRKPRGEGA